MLCYQEELQNILAKREQDKTMFEFQLCMEKEDDLISIFTIEETVPLTLRILACVSLEGLRVIYSKYQPTSVFFQRVFSSGTAGHPHYA
ncbi:hypothetical protein HUJ04_006906 [Dendroctonus ponderosae]|nr:hypothetical protein HUJ04_006906 [Dendroctonus ponderosae]